MYGIGFTLLMRGFCWTTLWRPWSVTCMQLMRARVLSLPLAFEVILIRISSLSRQLRGLWTITFNHSNMSLFTASLSDVQTWDMTTTSYTGRYDKTRNKASWGAFASLASCSTSTALDLEDSSILTLSITVGYGIVSYVSYMWFKVCQQHTIKCSLFPWVRRAFVFRKKKKAMEV